MKNKIQILTSAFLAFMIIFSLASCKGNSDESVVLTEEDKSYYTPIAVYNNSQPVNEDFKGINGVHMGWEYMYDTIGANRIPLKDWQRETVYDRIAYTMGVKQIRTFYTSAFAFDEEKNAWQWDVEKNKDLKGFYESLKAWQKRDVEVGMAAQWSMGAFDASASNTGNPVTSFAGNGFYVEGDLDATLKNYRNFIKDTVLSLEANGIHNVKYLFAFTECNNTYLSKNNKLNPTASAFENRDYKKVSELFGKAVTALDAGLKDAGKRDKYKIVGPCDNFRTDFDYTDAEQYSYLSKYTLENLADKVDIIGSHGGYSYADQYTSDVYYDNPITTMQKTTEMTHNAGKEFWIDEYNAVIYQQIVNDVKENRVLQENTFKGVALGASVNGIMNMGVDNVFLWAMGDIQWPNITRSNQFDSGLLIFGFLPSPTESMMPYPSYYSASLLTKYIGSGKVYNCDVSFGIYTSFIKRDDGEYTVVVTNYNTMEAPVFVKFEKSLKGKTFYRHLYDANNVTPDSSAEVIGVSATAKNVGDGFYDTLPPFSVAVYTTDKN